MKEHLIKWLNSKRNFIIGVVLYGQFGNDESVKKILATGKTDYTEKILLEKINALVKGEEQKAPVQAVKSYEAMPDDEDQVLQSLKNKWMPLFTEMNYKRHALDRLLDDPFEMSGVKRGQLARDILVLEKQCIDIWQDRDYYIGHGSLPGTSIDDETVVDPFQAAKRMENLKIYIRRYKTAVSKKPGDAKAAQLLKQYEEELKQLQENHG